MSSRARGADIAYAVAVAAVLAAGCAARRDSVVGPTRVWRPVPPGAYLAYLRGRLAHMDRDYPAAVAAFAEARGLAPDEPEPAAAHIESLSLAGRAPEAAREVAAAERKWPRAVPIALAAGATAYRAEAYADAARAYARAVALAPHTERAHLQLAQTRRRLGDREGELAAYRGLLEVAPASIAGNYRFGVRLAAAGAVAVAERHLRAALEREPDHLAARIELARLLRATGRAPAARAALREAFDRGGASARGARRILGRIRRDGAAAAIDAARALDRDDLAPEVRIALGEQLLADAAYGEALRLARRVRAGQPDHAGARRLEARALLGWLANS